MAARTSTQTGLFSAGTTWVGGVAPVDGDTVTIASPHVVTFDQDTSAYATGLGITVNSGGTLTWDTTPGVTRYLKMSANFSLQGTLNIGSAATAYPSGSTAVINYNGNRNFVVGAAAVANIFCYDEVIKSCKLTSQAASGAVVLSVDTDVRSGTYWSSGNLVAIVDIAGTLPDMEVRAIGTATSTGIPLLTGLTNQKEIGAYVFILRRNVRIIGGTGTGTSRFSISSASSGSTIRAECYDTSGTAGWFNGVGYNWVLPGIYYGTATGITNMAGVTMSGILLPSSIGITGGYGGLVTGIIAGMTSANSTNFDTLGRSGLILGCVNGYTISTCTICGTVSGNTRGLNQGNYLLKGAVFANNSNADIDFNNALRWSQCIGYGASLNSTTQFNTNVGGKSSDGVQPTIIYDIGRVAGSIKGWMPGGTLVSDTSTLPTNAPSDITQTIKISPATQVPWVPAYLDTDIQVFKNKPVKIVCYIKKDTNSMIETPKIQLIDPNYQTFLNTVEILSSQTMVDDTNWQTLVIDYAPSYDRKLVIRVRGTHSSGNFWFALKLRNAVQYSPSTGGIIE